MHKKFKNFIRLLKVNLTIFGARLLLFNNNLVFAYDGQTYNGDLKQAPAINVTGNTGTTKATATQNGQQVDTASAINQYLGAYRYTVTFILAAVLLITLGLFTYWTLDWARNSANSMERASAAKGMQITFVVFAILGAATWIVGIAYNII